MRFGRRELNALLNVALLPTVVAATVTGLIAEIFDINDWVLHKYPAYLLAVLVSLHIALKLRQLWAGTKILVGARVPRPPAIRPHPADAGEMSRVSRRGMLGLMFSGAVGLFAGSALNWQRNPLPRGEDIGDVYHQWSKPGYASLFSIISNWGDQPPLYKDYSHADKIALPRTVARAGMSLEAAIDKRRSVRDYAAAMMTLDELSRLLHFSTGINDNRWGMVFRATPSAGAQFPVETYAVIHSVAGLDRGLYHYNVRDHALERMRAGDLRQSIMDIGLGQEFLSHANLVIVLTSIFQRARWRYAERTYRYALLEEGHIAQNVYLMGTALHLGVCAVGAFWDDDLNDLLQVDGKGEAGLYLLAVGRL